MRHVIALTAAGAIVAATSYIVFRFFLHPESHLTVWALSLGSISGAVGCSISEAILKRLP